jgi:diguanylate cyclase (GGDEF)-like protein/PAS domain S-box-containing protein
MPPASRRSLTAALAAAVLAHAAGAQPRPAASRPDAAHPDAAHPAASGPASPGLLAPHVAARSVGSGDTVTIAGRVVVGSGVLQARTLWTAVAGDSGGLWVYARQIGPTLREGDSVRATGLVQRYRGTLELVSTGVTVVAPGRGAEAALVPAPTRDAGAPPTPTAEGRVVRVRGVVGAYGTSEGGTWLRLHGESRPGRAAGRDSATVWVGSGHAGLAAVRALRAGDLVEVTGVAATYQDNPGDAPVWQVIPRRDADVVTLGLPGRWSELAAMAGAAFVALLLAAAVGARVLNRRHARALAETEGRYRQLLALCPDAVLVHAEGRVLFANPAAARLLGTPDAAALAGRALADFQLAAVAPDAAAAAAGAERARFRAVGGAAVDVEVTTSPCRYHDRDAAVLIARDVGARLRYERELRELALLDELTGLHNRRGFHTFAEAELRRAVITGREVHLVFADLDGLKLINDGFGHAAGDAALRAVARALHDLVGAQGLAARWSGDEFAALYLAEAPAAPTGADPADADAAATAAVQRRMAELVALHAPAAPYTVGASVGVRRLGGRPGESLADALEAADAGLYRGRANRRDGEARDPAGPRAIPVGAGLGGAGA